MKNKIVLIVPYFGKFNNYFNLFLNSCSNNTDVDWLFYTDIEYSEPVSENIKFINISFESFRDRVQQNFNFPICLDFPYKLCDYKPAYGEILQSDISDYAFWGHCDCDLIFGKISNFISDDILNRYDKIFTRGHLTIYRNDPIVNSLYRNQRCYDLKKVFQSPKSFAFDEWKGVSKVWEMENKAFYDELLYDDIRVGLKALRPTKEVSGSKFGPYHNQADLSYRFKKMEYICYEYNDNAGTLERIWKQGKKIYREEILYVHLQKRKMDVDKSIVLRENFGVFPGRFISHRNYDLKSIEKYSIRKYSYNDLRTLIKFQLSILASWIKDLIKLK